MSTVDGIRISADAGPALAALDAAIVSFAFAQLGRAINIARHNGYQPLRFVVGSHLARRLELDTAFGSVERVFGVPVTVDEAAPYGFGLVAR